MALGCRRRGGAESDNLLVIVRRLSFPVVAEQKIRK